ncbi:hypothetical protein ACIQWR_01110 [Streptomyces sp. NPDC098789]|uniref:hypothetical protein n=1 Tax=Streptomyces sp. NPDC098789 TaxID=3366098 RepID=UPI003804489D
MNHDATYEFPEGKLYITIIKAQAKEENWGDARGKHLFGRLAVSSSTDEDNEPGFLKIRGREYRLGARRIRNPERHSAHLGRWRWDNPTVRWECTNREGKEVGWNTAASGRLSEMVGEAADRFEAEHPEWRRTSERLELENELRNTEVARAGVCDALRKTDAKIIDLHARIAAYAV